MSRKYLFLLITAVIAAGLVIPALADDQNATIQNAPGSGGGGGAETAIPQNQGVTTTTTITVKVPNTPPDSILYPVKLWIEDAQETLQGIVSGKEAMLKLKEQHLQNRMDELQYEARFNNNKNSAKLLQRIQTKRLEIEEEFDKLKNSCEPNCGQAGGEATFKTKEANDLYVQYSAQVRHNTEVLNGLLNSPTMPAASKNGLMNAVNRSGVRVEKPEDVVGGSGKIKVGANMTQMYQSSSLRLVPFKSANFYVQSDNKWYSIVIYGDKVTLSDHTLSHPEYTMILTDAQAKELMQIAQDVNKQGKLSWSDTGKLMSMWFNIKKTAG